MSPKLGLKEPKFKNAEGGRKAKAEFLNSFNPQAFADSAVAYSRTSSHSGRAG
jgi:hypothetical protein